MTALGTTYNFSDLFGQPQQGQDILGTIGNIMGNIGQTAQRLDDWAYQQGIGQYAPPNVYSNGADVGAYNQALEGAYAPYNSMMSRRGELLKRREERAAEMEKKRRFQGALGNIMRTGGFAGPLEQYSDILMTAQSPEEFSTLGNIIKTINPEPVKPDIKEVDGSLVAVNPNTGEATKVYESSPNPMELLNLQEKQLQIQKLNNELSAGGIDPKDRMKAEDDLRKEFTNLNKDFIKVRDAYAKITSAEATPAGDISLLINYMKILDPGSVVREGEFATAQNAAGVPDRLRNIYNNVLEGTRLNPEQRADFLRQAQNLYDSQTTGYEQLRTQYEDIATRNNLDVSNVLLDLGLSKITNKPTGRISAEQFLQGG